MSHFVTVTSQHSKSPTDCIRELFKHLRDETCLLVGNEKSFRFQVFMGNVTSGVGLDCCSNLSVGVALNERFTMNGMCAKNNTMYMWHKQAIIE